MKRKLNDRQRLFIAEYIKSRNATQSAIKAGYTKNAAAEAGYHLLSNAHIRKAVDKGLEHLVLRADITAQKVLNTIASIAFSEKATTRNSDKLKAGELLGKNLKLFTDVSESKVEALVSVVDEAQVKAVREKIKGDC